MVRVLDSGASGPGLNPGQGHCVMYLGKTLYSCSQPLCNHVYNGVWANLMLRGNPVMG